MKTLDSIIKTCLKITGSAAVMLNFGCAMKNPAVMSPESIPGMRAEHRNLINIREAFDDYLYRFVNTNEIEPVILTDDHDGTLPDYSILSWDGAIMYVRTPQQTMDYLDKQFSYEKKDTTYIPRVRVDGPKRWESFRINHGLKKGNCYDYATVAAALLSDDGFPPNILVTEDTGNNERHALFLYRTDQGYGAIGNSSLDDKYASIPCLLEGLHQKYDIKADKWFVVSLEALYPNGEWIRGDCDLLVELPPN